jgi:hypothetical protein
VDRNTARQILATAVGSEITWSGTKEGLYYWESVYVCLNSRPNFQILDPSQRGDLTSLETLLAPFAFQVTGNNFREHIISDRFKFTLGGEARFLKVSEISYIAELKGKLRRAVDKLRYYNIAAAYLNAGNEIEALRWANKPVPGFHPQEIPKVVPRKITYISRTPSSNRAQNHDT